MAEHEWAQILVPRDIEADVLEALGRFGIDAATAVPAERRSGMVRVSRTGGPETMQGQRDRPTILVEVWADDSVAAFDLSRPVYAAFKVFSHRQYLLPDVAAHDVQMEPPRALDDPDAPELYRVQFTVEMTVPLTTIDLMEVIPNGE